MSESWTLPTRNAGVSFDEVSQLLSRTGILRIAGFPADADRLMDFLARLGNPLVYYGGDAGTHPDHEAIWRVRYDPEASARGEGHAIDGPLAVHSSQSLLEPRPRYFAMLMVDPGWQNQPPGFRGESLLASWSRSFQFMSKADGTMYARDLETLLSPIPFPDGSERTMVYDLPAMAHKFDYGVRLKSDLLEYLRSSGREDRMVETVERFVQASQQTAYRLQLAAGDLVVVDNNRWGHGRESVVGSHESDRGLLFNPRELWSLTIA